MKQSNQSESKQTSPKRRLLSILFTLVPFMLMYWIFAIKIPSQVSYAEVWNNITSLTLGQNLLLLLCGLLTIAVYGWTSSSVLLGLSLKRGIQSASTGQLTSVVLPVPLDLVIRFRMYKSYGFSVDKATVAVGMAGIARYFTVFAIPLLGLGVLILVGQGTREYVVWLVGVGAVYVVALWAMAQILGSKKSAGLVGAFAQKALNYILKLIRRGPNTNIKDKVVEFGSRMNTVAISNIKAITISNISWGFSCYLVLFFALRFCGVDSSQMSAAYILLVTGMMLLFNAFPITPGGIGVTETLLITIIPFSGPTEQAAFTAALFVYRIYTWLLPLPVGTISYLTWRYELRKV